MTERIIKMVETRIGAYKDIICHDWLDHDEAVGMNARLSELEEILEQIKNLAEES